ncbi:uncharacterized protein L203_104238 [Cryptococcus depauperatus CBS 7841]|uniref:Uncharacterized protein n=1 Tax=Cryptococcus depauperatus CBS 7841 TaxID=1295531 RepID=A0AAJ8JVB0_9TREE
MVMVVWIPSSLFLLSLLTVAFAVKFDLEAEYSPKPIKFFSILIICGTIGLGVWQLVHLRSFFKRKYLID